MNNFRKTILCGMMSVALALSTFSSITAYARVKTVPKLSVEEYSTKKMTQEKNYTIRLKGAGKSKVKWTVKKNRGFDGSVLKVVKKNKKNLVVKPLKNGSGSIVCRVGKTRLEFNYSVYLKDKTEAADKNLSDDELYHKFMNNEIPVLYGLNDYAYETESVRTDNNWYYLADIDGYDANYKIKEKVDLDNDGQNEAILEANNTSYGSRYLDTQDGKVYQLGQGDASDPISYTNYKGNTWIVYSHTDSAWFAMWALCRYQSFGRPVEIINLKWEDNEDDTDDRMEENDHYYYNDEEITLDEFIDYIKEIGYEEDLEYRYYDAD